MCTGHYTCDALLVASLYSTPSISNARMALSPTAMSPSADGFAESFEMLIDNPAYCDVTFEVEGVFGWGGG